jgi:hypothetical protein
VQREQLLTESQVFEQKVFPGTESADHPAEKMPERHDHGKNFIGIVRIELFAKSFILRVYNVLARHSLPNPNEGYPCGLLYQRDSNLFVIEQSATIQSKCEPRLYVWLGSRFEPL